MTLDPLQRYQVMEALGEGGQGSTYRGIDRATRRDVAIKVLSLKRMGKWKHFDLFEREVEVLESLDHPGIPRYIDDYASESTGDYFLVMELVEGRPLSAFVRGQQRMRPDTLRQVLVQALEILRYLHGLSPPVIHRDIKPANLILDREGRVKLVDFGGVRRALSPEGGSTMIGTFGYMAPEQLHGDASPATDIYGLGATIAALVAGMDADDLPREGLRIDVSAIGAPAWLRPVLEGMLEPDPNDRLQSADAVLERLQAGAPDGTSRRAGKGGRPSKPSSREEALVPMPARELAKVPAPFSVLIWMLTALGAGMLLVFEVVVLPLVHRVVAWWHANHSTPEQRQAFEEEYERLEGSIRRGRDTLGWVADRTRPTPTPRDDREVR